MPTFIVRSKNPFRRGMGAAALTSPANYWGGRPGISGRPIITGVYAVPPAGGAATAPAAVSPSGSTTTIGTTTRFWRPGSGQYGQGQGYAGGQPPSTPPWQQASGSAVASQSTMATFNAALAQAVAMGVITTQQASQYQAMASGQTDATVTGLTQQINQMVSATTSAAAGPQDTSAVASAATTSTSWWDGSTTVFGSVVSNSTLAIGAGLAAVALWAAFKKK